MAQDNDQRTRILITIGVVAVMAIIGLALWWFFFREQPAPDDTTTPAANANTSTTTTTVNASLPPEPTPATEEESETLEAVRVATLFAERWGSYSSEADFQNIEDLTPYMTDNMKTWSEDYVSVQRAQSSGDFVSVETRVYSTRAASVSGSQATVMLTTQRIEDEPTDRSYYQEVELSMKSQDGDWLVDAIDWKEEGLPDTEPETETETETEGDGEELTEQELRDLITAPNGDTTTE